MNALCPQDLQTRISALVQRHQLSNASRLQRAAALQTQLTHRVLKLVQHLHLLIPALRSSALRPEEEALRTALEEIDEEVRRPGGTGRIRGKLNELWALVGAVTAARERDRRPGPMGADGRRAGRFRGRTAKATDPPRCAAGTG